MSKSNQVNSVNGNFAEPCLRFLSKADPTVRAQLATTTSLGRAAIEAQGTLDQEQLLCLVDQALLLIQENYVHRPLKEAMHGVDPIQRLRLIRHRLEEARPEEEDGTWETDEYEFHREMLEVFNSVRDLHTNYLLPDPFSRKVAFLPFDVEEYFDEEHTPHYLATHFVKGYRRRNFKPGVEITMWNGVPIKRAIEVIADRTAGGNLAARHTRGIERLTKRPLIVSLPPDELWVEIGYIDLEGNKHEMRQEWLVFTATAKVAPESVVEHSRGIEIMNATNLGIDLEMDINQETKKTLFAPQIVEAQKDIYRELATEKSEVCEDLVTRMPRMFKARCFATASGEIGYIRIYTFNLRRIYDPSLRGKPKEFVREFIRLLKLLPQNGLIIDVRGNPGGHIWASEGLLQLFSPGKIEPAPAQFINTSLNLRICERHANGSGVLELEPWVQSIRDSVETGAIYSRSFPITPADFANRWGQQYHGPVVLVTDARCYSATDMFAAGFEDHQIGHIIGVDENTGAGGANVWDHSLLRETALPGPDSPYKMLPNNAGMRVSIRRTLRVGMQAGTPVEDIGIRTRDRHFLTKDDLLYGNKDLIDYAATLLAAMPQRQLVVSYHKTNGSKVDVQMTTKGLSRIDVYINGRPVESLDVDDGQSGFVIDAPAPGSFLELAGYENGTRVAARKIKLYTDP